MLDTYLEKYYDEQTRINTMFREMSLTEKARHMGITTSTLQRLEDPCWMTPKEHIRKLLKENQRLKKIADQYIDSPKISGVSFSSTLKMIQTLYKVRWREETLWRMRDRE